MEERRRVAMQLYCLGDDCVEVGRFKVKTLNWCRSELIDIAAASEVEQFAAPFYYRYPRIEGTSLGLFIELPKALAPDSTTTYYVFAKSLTLSDIWLYPPFDEPEGSGWEH